MERRGMLEFFKLWVWAFIFVNWDFSQSLKPRHTISTNSTLRRTIFRRCTRAPYEFVWRTKVRVPSIFNSLCPGLSRGKPVLYSHWLKLLFRTFIIRIKIVRLKKFHIHATRSREGYYIVVFPSLFSRWNISIDWWPEMWTPQTANSAIYSFQFFPFVTSFVMTHFDEYKCNFSGK